MGTQPYAKSTGRTQRVSKRNGAATALGLGAPPQNALLSGIKGPHAGTHLTTPARLIIWIDRREPVGWWHRLMSS